MLLEFLGHPHGILEELPHPPGEGVAVGAHEAPSDVLRDGPREVAGPREEAVHVRELHGWGVCSACSGTNGLLFIPIFRCLCFC